KLERPTRKFLPETFTVTGWEQLKPYFDKLLEKEINSVEGLRSWLQDRSELESVISEDFAWRYINMTRFTENETYSKAYQDFVENIQPKIAPVSDQLNRKAAASEFLDVLANETGYDIMIRNLKKDIEIFREENIPLFTELSLEQQKYNTLAGAMMVELDGKELTLQQASVKLMSTNREEREQVYHK